MTQKQLYDHYLSILQKTEGHTIVKHKRPSGDECWRIRDATVNPIDNIPSSIFDKYIENNIVHKINDREWQLKP